jgi:hypothetical protein
MCEGDWEKFNDEYGAFPKWWSVENIYTTTDGFTMILLMCGVCDKSIKGILATPEVIKRLTQGDD